MPERQHVTIDDWPALSVQHYFPEPLTLDNQVSGELTLNIPQLDRIAAKLERRKSSAWPWIVGGALVTAAGVGTYCAIKGDCIRIVARSTSSSSLAIKF
ncbi:MAG: hypothetical protein Q8O71_00910 [bacterium]|nr:hypothetical protein [bacterium]